MTSFSPDRFRTVALMLLLGLMPLRSPAEGPPDLREHPGLVIERVAALARSHPGETAAFILSKGRDAIMARAWMVNNAHESLDVQTLIWKMDGLGTLATEALLRAAERGVRVRVALDAYLREAPKDLLLALARHPNIDIRIYNPTAPTEVRWFDSVFGFFFDRRRVNQRMHNKKFMIDGRLGITGGRNVADEYFQYNAKYNFHDRDVLLLGDAVKDMVGSFDRYWESPLMKPVEELWRSKERRLSDEDVQAVYGRLHDQANDPELVPPEVREALREQPLDFWNVLDRLVWTDVRFVSDRPEKNIDQPGLGGGSRTEIAVKNTLDRAKERILIQNPYVVLSPKALALDDRVFEGVEVWINTNSLASTDEVAVFSGYQKQREKLLKLGVHLRELQPHPAIQEEAVHRRLQEGKSGPILTLHAKTAVVDGELLFIGTFNLDPRSANLNTEEGVIIRNRELAAQVEEVIRRDMQPENSWDPAKENPDAQASLWRRMSAWFFRLLPIDPLL